MHFIQQIIKGEKEVLDKTNVKYIEVPQWPELSLNRVLPVVIKDDTVKLYLPDYTAGDKMPPRDYFWNVMFTIKPDFTSHLLS